MLRRLLIVVLVFLIAVVVAVDRVGAIVGAHVLASKLESDEGLPNRPSVSIHGIPFLTQAIGGKYSNVSVTASEVPVDQVPVTTLHVDLHGVHVPLSKVISGSVSQVPVDRITGSVLISFADANRYLAKHSPVHSLVSLRPGTSDAAVSVLDRTRIGGQLLHLHGVGTLSVADNVVSVDVSKLTGSGKSGGSAYSSTLSLALRALDITFPLEEIPFQLRLTSVTVTSSGIQGSGSAQRVVLGEH